MHYLQQINNIINAYGSLGTMALDNGARLVGKTPHVGSNAWLHILYTAISDEDVDALESSTGICFPNAFRDFLTMSNGINVFSNSLSIYGKRENYKRTGDVIWQPFDIITPNTVERIKDATESMLFIGGYPSGTGFYLYIDIRDNCVYLSNRRSAKPLFKWNCFEEMLLSEVVRLSKLFANNGKKVSPNESVLSGLTTV